MTSSRTAAASVPPDQVERSVLQRAQLRTGFEEEYPFESHWYRAGEHTLHYIDEGSGPPLLMVHGNPTWSFAWRRFVKELSREYRVIAIDHLGCGFSEKPQDRGLYVLDQHIARLAGLVESLDLQDVTLFGHDWGGAIGMGCAGRQPSRFKRFVLMNTAAFRSRRIPVRIALCRIPVLGRIAVQGLNLFSLMALRMAVSQPLPRPVRDGLVAPYDSWQNRIAVHEFVQDIPLQQSHRSYQTLVDVEQCLAQFQNHPVLLVWGMQDWCFTPEFLDEFRKRFPAAEELPLEQAGHYVFEDGFQDIMPRVRKFLSQ